MQSDSANCLSFFSTELETRFGLYEGDDDVAEEEEVNRR
jgi:hypothetical protein